MLKKLTKTKTVMIFNIKISLNCGLLRSITPASVSLSVTRAGCAKTAKRIDVLFGADIHVDPRNTVPVLDGGEGR